MKIIPMSHLKMHVARAKDFGIRQCEGDGEGNGAFLTADMAFCLLCSILRNLWIVTLCPFFNSIRIQPQAVDLIFV